MSETIQRDIRNKAHSLEAVEERWHPPGSDDRETIAGFAQSSRNTDGLRSRAYADKVKCLPGQFEADLAAGY